MIVGVIEFIDVRALHLPLIGTVAQGDALHQCIGAGLEIDQHVGLLNFFCQGLVHFVIHVKLVTFEVDLSKERILRKGVIGKKVLSRSDELMHGSALLVIATQQKENLGLKGVTFAIRVEIGKKGILLENFQ